MKNHPSIWYHVDSAWAGVAFACPEFRTVGKLDAINKYADSFCTNFHKVGLVVVLRTCRVFTGYPVGSRELRRVGALGDRPHLFDGCA